MRPFLAAVLLAMAQPTSAAIQAPVEITTTEISPGIYQFNVADDGYVEQLNSVAIVTDRDVVVFDTTTRPSTARTILAKIRSITNKPVRYVVNSHWHPDHWSGNEVFAEAFPNLEIIATEQERDFMLNTTAQWAVFLPRSLSDYEGKVASRLATGKDRRGQPLTADGRQNLTRELQLVRDMTAEQLAVHRTYPTLTYTDQLTLRHGGRELHFISVTGDAAGTTVLYLPKEKVLITGDVVSYPVPYFTPPLSQHAKSLRALAALDAVVIIPGHGPAFHDKGYMLREAELFEEVLRQVQAALRGGAVSIQDVQARMNFAAFRDRFAHGDKDIADEFGESTEGMVRDAFVELRDNKQIR